MIKFRKKIEELTLTIHSLNDLAKAINELAITISPWSIFVAPQFLPTIIAFIELIKK